MMGKDLNHEEKGKHQGLESTGKGEGSETIWSKRRIDDGMRIYIHYSVRMSPQAYGAPLLN